eukprot:GHVP01014820.1.p1 GENE.GHVP01014820.1~~GHVP01014820.1.p1  ORF type:complete len:290 (-),score=38.89 GHVP01014820.1:181-1050(-)
MRFRLRLVILDSIFKTTLDLWNAGITHCDLHFSNIMFLREYVTVRRARELTWSGRAMPLNFLSWFEMARNPGSSPPSSDNNDVVQIVKLAPKDVRFIDHTFAFNFNQLKLPLSQIHIPCRIYKTERSEDLVELERVGISVLLDKQTGPSVIFAEEIKNLKEDYLYLHNDFTTKNLVGMAIYKEIEEFIQSMQVLFQSANQLIYGVSEFKQCLEASRDWTKKKYNIRPLIKSQKQRLELWKHLDHDCTMAMQENAMEKLRSHIASIKKQALAFDLKFEGPNRNERRRFSV